MRTTFIMMLVLCSLTGFSKPGDNKTGNTAAAKNIILLIGDGMGVSQVSAALTVNGGHLNIVELNNIGLSKTQAATDFITDSGAGGTAIATGYKTYGYAIGVDKDTIPRKSILEYADTYGKSTGMVVTSEVTHATPASFIAHQKSRYMYEEIAADFLKTDIDVFIGGGRNHFNQRKDQRDLTVLLSDKGYQLAYTLSEVDRIQQGKLAGLLYPEEPPRWSDGRGDMLQLSVEKAIELLDQDEDGFFLMVEGSQIDWGGHDNDTDYILEEMLDFDKTVGDVLEFARKDGNTLVIVTADHETGGMSLSNGNMTTGSLQAKYTGTGHTGVMVPVFSFGPGSDNFRGTYENTELFQKMMKAFGFSPAGEVN
jgi:alkaline phosphatase